MGVNEVYAPASLEKMQLASGENRPSFWAEKK
jgi:hypothetical protein